MFVHPGEWRSAEIVEVLRLDVTNAAARHGVSRDGSGELLGGRLDLSADIAMRFEKAFGVKADTLMLMLAAHDSVRQTGHR